MMKPLLESTLKRLAAFCALLSLSITPVFAQTTPLVIQTTWVKVVNMIPQIMSGETANDAEPNIAVNPSNTAQIVASAFTPNPTGAANLAPVFISTNGGTTWAVNNIVPSANGMTGDITVRFAGRGNTLYAGILRGGSFLNLRILRTANPFGAAAMTQLVNNASQDQPYVEATTTDPGGGDVDRVYVGLNNWGQRISGGGTGQTATEQFSLNARTAGAPAGFNPTVIEARATFEQDMPAIRTAVHSNGTVYAIFYRWTAGNVPNASNDVVVVRDNNWGAGANPFTALKDPGDANSGVRVVTGVTVPAFPATLGSNRLVASNLSIAINPNNSAEVWIAWADNNGSNYTLHVRRSTNSGATWSLADVKTVNNATNPALAINNAGRVGFLYQQLTGPAAAQTWETHFETTTNAGAFWTDTLLARTSDSVPANFFIGDYVHVMAVGETFYGVFSATNIPNSANFPQGVTFARNANFNTQTLLNTDGVTAVNPSIDPFFFKVSYRNIFYGCLINPNLCRVRFVPGLIIFEPCDGFPCVFWDPIPKNCLVKWECPGCGPYKLCPPWHHIFLDEFDPRVWDVDLYNEKGDLVEQVIRRTKTGIVLSFRPSKMLYREGEIGDYFLGFAAKDGVKLGTEYRIKSRLEVSDFPVPGKSPQRTKDRQ